MNEYFVKLNFHGTVSYEDPKCPWNWRGSGVYIIENPVEVSGECSVIAPDEARARELVDDFAFDPKEFELEEVEIAEVSLVGPADEEDAEQVYDVLYGSIPEKDDYPEPDDCYEELLLRKQEEEKCRN